jgi:hypothetical protein
MLKAAGSSSQGVCVCVDSYGEASEGAIGPSNQVHGPHTVLLMGSLVRSYSPPMLGQEAEERDLLQPRDWGVSS